MKSKSIFLTAIALFTLNNLFSQGISTNSDTIERKHFIGSTAFIIATPLLSPSPEYFQLNFGYRLTSKDVVSVEAITWAYHAPLGIPYAHAENPENYFPGKVKALGLGLTYKRFLWKGVYTQIHSTALSQRYLDLDNAKIQNGFQLFNTLRFGYHINLFKKHFFIEPSVAFTSWPINTNLPDSFQVEEDKWNKYFLFEPGFHFGVNF